MLRAKPLHPCLYRRKRGLATRLAAEQAGLIAAAKAAPQVRWRSQALGVVPTISKNAREKWLESEKPTRAAIAARDSAGSSTMSRWALLMRASICQRCSDIPVAFWKERPNCVGDILLICARSS